LEISQQRLVLRVRQHAYLDINTTNIIVVEFMYVCPLEAMNDENTYLFKLAEVCFPLCDYDLSIRMSLETPEVIETISCSSHDVMIEYGYASEAW
jgi:hypothetical protein